MSDDRKVENNFKFGVYLGREKIYEKIFSADLYNPVVRYSVDIRDRIPSIISNLQASLSMPSKDLSFELALRKDHTIVDFSDLPNANAKNYYKHICKINRMHPIKLFVPTQNKIDASSPKAKYQGRGTEFKFGVYINANPIVERNFYVENYNPESRFSNEFYDLLNDIVDYLQAYLKKSDHNHMWNDYDLIAVYGFNSIQPVRELSKERREELLNRKSDLAFVEKVRMEYHKNSEYPA
jgi:hypothetical protein